MKKEIVIGSRESVLAVVQSEMVKQYIEQKNPGLAVRILTMKTTGDQILNQPLEKIGGKGLFVKELDRALSEGRFGSFRAQPERRADGASVGASADRVFQAGGPAGCAGASGGKDRD